MGKNSYSLSKSILNNSQCNFSLSAFYFSRKESNQNKN